MRGYDRSWLRSDAVAGVTAGTVVVPQAMGYATIADLPPQVGLYTCVLPMAVYALLGGSRTMSVSTTSTIASLTASTMITAGLAADSDDPVATVTTLTLLVGVLLLLARLLHLSNLVDMISEPVLVGVRTGVGLTVAAGQLPHLLGVSADPDATGFFREVGAVLDALPDANGPTLVLGLGTVAVLYALARFAPACPAPSSPSSEASSSPRSSISPTVGSR